MDMPIKDVRIPKNAPTKERSRLWIDPVTADVFRKVARYTRMDMSVLLDDMIRVYVKTKLPQLEIEEDPNDFPVTPPDPEATDRSKKRKPR